MESNVILVDDRDNVAVAVVAIKSGGPILGLAGTELRARSDVPKNHKVAVAGIAKGSPVIKYGEPIGVASEAIEPGDWVHTHNLGSGEGQ